MHRPAALRFLSIVAAAAALLAVPWPASAKSPPITVPFDHLTTGFELDGVHSDLPCEACHLNAVFKGTPTDCGTCHVSGSPFNGTPKTALHIPTSNNCAACHNTFAFRPDVHFDHGEVVGSCVSCHNGTIAQGEGPTHPPTSQACEACHSVESWNPPKAVDHSQIPLAVAGFCIVCHNGVQASGKSANHIATNLECGDCHLTSTWAGAGFDHKGITSGCVSCHDGTKAVGKQGNHMPTTNVCENCHTSGIGTSTPSWVPSLFDHTQMTVSSCQTCHSGTVKISTGFVPGQPVNHVPPIPPTVDCGVCHGNTPNAETWTVLAVGIPALHAGLNVSNCLLCHAGETFAGVPAPYIPMSTSGVSPNKATPLSPPHIPILAGTDCSACHAAAYLAGGFGPATAMSAAKHAFVSGACNTCHEAGMAFYTGSGAALQTRPADHTSPGMAAPNDCSNCHETTDWNSTALPPGHMPNPGNQGCAVCHTGIPANYTTLAANSVLHTGITGGCSQCHGATAPLTFYNNFTPKSAVLSPGHIPYLAGIECNACHSTSTYAVGTFGPMNMTAATHAFVPTTCDACHEAGLSFTMGSASPALQARPADHLASANPQEVSGDCSLCHTPASWATTVLPAGHMPNPGNQACAVCHTGAPNVYTTLASNAVLHTGITNGCNACHGSTAPLTFYNNFTPKSAVLSPAHIPFVPTSTPCESCHAATVFTSFSGTTMSAAKHAFVATTCDTCHEAGLSFYPGAALNLQGRPADHTAVNQAAPNDCSGCHETVDWNSTAFPSGHMPNPGNQGCLVCHTAAPANYTTLAPNAVLHTGISGGCAQCHGSTTVTLTFYNNFSPKSAVLSPVHIPLLAGADCSACHSSTTYAVGGFGGMVMSAATHAYVVTTCDTCHEIGSNFYPGAALNLQTRPNSGTFNHLTSSDPNQVSGDCSLCHSTSSWSSNVPPAGHMPNPAGNACAVCHTTASSTPGTPDYTQYSLSGVHAGSIVGVCGICHSGASWIGAPSPIKPKSLVGLAPAHIPLLAGADCGSCHVTTGIAIGGFANTTMSAAKHAFVAATCDTCHEAGLSFYPGAALNLQGRPADHTANNQQAPNDCSACHETTDWNSTALPAGHMPNPGNQQCNTCHTAAPSNYTTLASNPVLHTGIASGCSTCHGYTAALTFYNNFTPKSAVLSPSHIPLLAATTACESCHSATVFSSFSGTTMSAARHAFVAATCDTCHEAGLTFYPGAALSLQGRPADHTPANQAAPNDCNGCHETTDWNSTVLPAGHMPNPASQACTVCHTAAPTNYTTLAANSVLHTGITTGCNACHGYTAALTFYNNFTPKSAVLSPSHIPLLAATTPCESCHATTTFAVGAFGPMNMTAATHAFVAATCDTCHEAGLSFTMGSASPALQGRPADHTSGQMVSPNQCSLCHTTANWNSTALPAGHMPNPANQACSLCHTTAPNDYSTTTLAANAILHTGITSGCIACHGGPGGALTFYNNFTPKSAVLAPVHIPTSTTACEACHSTTSFATNGFSGTTMTAAKHTSMFTVIGSTCDACHNAVTPALSFYGVTNLTTRPSDHNQGSKLTSDCKSCHSPTGWGGNRLVRKVAATTTGAAGSSTTTAVAVPATAAAVAATSSTAAAGGAAARPLSHAGVTANCVSCHNGTLAGGKGPTHIASNASCENCHTTNAWLPARFDHQGITAPCTSCHNGALAAGKPRQHVVTSQDCVACHGTLAWLPAHFSHYGVVGTCQSCHNGLTAPGKPLQHPATTLDCASCHTTQNWWTVTQPPAAAPAGPAARGPVSRPVR